MEPKRQGAGEPALPARREQTRTIPAPGGSPPGPSRLRTRANLPRTRAIYARPVRKADAVGEEYGGRVSLVARRSLHVQRGRRKTVLLVAAVLLGLFPPVWAAYLVAWLVWRSRPKNKSMRYVRRAIRALEREQHGIALKQLQEAHLLDPSNNDALYWLGLLLAEQHRPQEAVEALSIVGERLPGLPEVEEALAESCYALGDYEAAVHHAQRVLELDPYNLPVLVRLADSFEALGQVGVAIETLRYAPLYKRTLDEPLKLVHYRLGELHERQGDTAKALEHYHRVYASDAAYLDVAARVAALRPGEP